MEVIVKIIKTTPWTGLTKWTKCFDVVTPYIKRSGILYTGLTSEDERRLEKAIGYPEGYLAATNNDFWQTFAIKLGVDDTILHTDNPHDELRYLFLKGHKRVADGLQNLDGTRDYVLINRDAEAEEKNKFNRVKRDAYVNMDKMSLDEMRKCLRLYGYASDSMSTNLIESKLAEEIEKDPAKFNRIWVNNKDKEINVLIEEAIAKNIIRKNRTQYFYGTDMIGNSLNDAIAYLKEKKNQEIKLTILQEIQAK